jgi:hypothetical protein
MSPESPTIIELKKSAHNLSLRLGSTRESEAVP